MVDLGFKYINCSDSFNRCPLDIMSEVTTNLMFYSNKHGLKDVYLECIEDCRYSDPENERYNIDILYTNEKGNVTRQRLLYLKGEVLDGTAFHERFEEFYGNTE